MKLYFFSYKSITITWFMVFTVLSLLLSHFLINILLQNQTENKKKIEDVFFYLVPISFIGSRLFYVIKNIDIFKDNLHSIFKISHYNLSLIGGVIAGLLTLKVLSKKYNISFEKLIKIFIAPFYLSMSIGVWFLLFDTMSISFKFLKGEPIEVLLISLLFFTSMVVELFLFKRTNDKKRILATLTSILLIYSIV